MITTRVPKNKHKHCPTCGRGPFFVVLQRVPPGAGFFMDSCPGPAAGVILPTGQPPANFTNDDDECWLPGEHVEWAGDERGWRTIKPC